MTRTKIVRVRLSPTEHESLKAKAGSRGVSALLRFGALGPDPRQEQKARLRVLGEVARARNILAEIARNFEPRPLVEQLHLLGRLIAVERQLMRFKS
jgi:hypothetical protein